MTNWTKVTPGKPGFRARTEPAVTRGAKGGTLALVLPRGYTEASAANIFSDGNGKLGFEFGDSGSYKLHKGTERAATLRVTIPKEFASRIPLGTTDAVLTDDGQIKVLDLSQFDAKMGG